MFFVFCFSCLLVICYMIYSRWGLLPGEGMYTRPSGRVALSFVFVCLLLSLRAHHRLYRSTCVSPAIVYAWIKVTCPVRRQLPLTWRILMVKERQTDGQTNMQKNPDMHAVSCSSSSSSFARQSALHAAARGLPAAFLFTVFKHFSSTENSPRRGGPPARTACYLLLFFHPIV